MMSPAFSMSALHFLGQNNQNQIQHDFFGHLTQLSLALASHDATVISAT